MAIKIMLSRKLGEVRWSQAELARATGIRTNTINLLYHDVSDRISLKQLDLISDALGCSYMELLDQVPNDKNSVKYKTGKHKK